MEEMSTSTLRHVLIATGVLLAALIVIIVGVYALAFMILAPMMA